MVNQKDSIKTKNQLLTAGFKLFGDKGFHKSKLQDVAKAAGLTRGAIYWHFKDKLDFYKELMKKGVEIIAYDQLSSLTNETKDPREKLVNLIKDQLSKYLHDRQYYSIAKVYYRFGIEIDDSEFVKKMTKLQITITKPTIMNVIKEGKENGQIKKDLEDEEIYLVLVILMTGLAGLTHSSADTFTKKLTNAKVIDAMLDTIFVNGEK